MSIIFTQVNQAMEKMMIKAIINLKYSLTERLGI
jgi:hypothetical protein